MPLVVSLALLDARVPVVAAIEGTSGLGAAPALALGLRSVRLVVASLLALVVGLVVTAAFATFAVGHLNLISVAFGVLYIGLGVDYAIHMNARYREEVGAGARVGAAAAKATTTVGVALVLATITTAVGRTTPRLTRMSGIGPSKSISEPRTKQITPPTVNKP